MKRWSTTPLNVCFGGTRVAGGLVEGTDPAADVLGQLRGAAALLVYRLCVLGNARKLGGEKVQTLEDKQDRRGVPQLQAAMYAQTCNGTGTSRRYQWCYSAMVCCMPRWMPLGGHGEIWR